MAGNVRGLVTDVPERALYWMIAIAEEMGGLPDTERLRLAASEAGIVPLRIPDAAGSATGRPYTDALSVDLGNGQTLWLKERGYRSAEGNRTIEVLPKVRRASAAMIALLTAMEGHWVKPDRASRMLHDEGIDVHADGFCHASRVAPGLPEARSDEQNEFVLLQYYVGALLDHFRPGFAKLPREQRLALVEGACTRVYKFLEALRQLVEFLEYGDPERDLRPSVENASRDVEAVVLKDVAGLKDRAIAERLGVALTEKAKAKSDYSTITKMVRRGRSILERAWGQEGWQQKAASMRSDAQRYNALDARERALETCAEILGASPEHAEKLLSFRQVPQGPDRLDRFCDVLLARQVYRTLVAVENR